MIDFSNLKIAYASLTDKELRKAYRLFSMVKSHSLVKIGKALLHFALLIHIPIKWIVKPTIFSHFCGGETISECEDTIEKLAESGIKTILDYSVEGSQNENDFDNTAAEILKTIQKSEHNKNISFCVFKTTGIASFSLLEKISAGSTLSEIEKDEYKKVYNRIDSLCQHAAKVGTPIFIDAEESWIQGGIDKICEEFSEKYNKNKAKVFNTLQMYRIDRLAYLQQTIDKAKEKNYYAGFKLVRGAYIEKERKRAADLGYKSPVYQTKEKTDAAYNQALEFCVGNISTVSVCAASHNEFSSNLLVNLSQKHNIIPSDSRISFAQLLGMSDHISYNLANEGFNVSKYVPFGPVKKVMPYLIRRAEENTSVAGQTLRELNLIKKEIQNRKKNKNFD